MKSTVKVSIGRLAFHLDAEAHQVLKVYLERLERHFLNRESGKEIVSDIEERLSELLTVRLTQPGQVVTLPMIQEVIAIMGMPDDMEEETGMPAMNPVMPEPRRKRLYRDPDNKMIGGVCSGLAAYFNTDKVFFRLFFILFFFGFFILRHAMGGAAIFTYVILWIAMPLARTAKEKLEMHGTQSPTVAEIERKMLEDMERPEKSIFARLVKGFFRAILVFIGIAILLAALIGFLFVPWSLLMFDFVPNIPMIDLLNYVNIGAPLWLVKTLIGAVMLLPLLGLVYLGVKALVGFKGKYRVGLMIFVLWLASLIGLTAVLVPTFKNHARWTNLQEDVVVTSVYDTLFVNVAADYHLDTDKMVVDYRDDDEFFVFWTNEAGRNTSFYMLPRVEIEHTGDTGDIRISYTRYAFGENMYKAKENLATLSPKFLLRDSLLLLEPFIFDKKNKWNGEMMGIKIYVPRNKEVKLQMLDGRRKYVKIKLRDQDIDIDID